MSVVTSTYTATSDGSRRHYIGYDNCLAGATLTATTEDTDHPASNLADWLTYSRYLATAGGTVYINADLGTAKSIDSFGLYGHNFALATSVKLQYSTDDITYTDYAAAENPPDSRPIFRVDKDNEITARYWRLEVVSAVAPELAVFYLGSAMAIPRTTGIGWTPPDLNRQPVIRNNRSRNGSLLARTRQREHGRVSFEIPYLEPDWIRTTWRPFVHYLHDGDGVFFHGWSMDRFPEETAYCFTDGNPGRAAYSELNTYMSLSLDVAALSR